MGKFMAALLLVFVLELSMFLFVAADSSNNGGTTLFTWLKAPVSSSNPFYGNILQNIEKIATISAIVVGFFFIVRVEVAYAGIAVVAVTFFLNITRFWAFIASQGAWGTDVNSGWLPATLICAPIIIFYTIATFDYIRQPG